MIRVVNVRGMNKPEQRTGIAYCGRPFAGWKGHPLSNPFKPEPLGAGGACQQTTEDRRQKFLGTCLGKYREWLLARPTLDADLAALWEETQHGALPLGCWWRASCWPRAGVRHALRRYRGLAHRGSGTARWSRRGTFGLHHRRLPRLTSHHERRIRIRVVITPTYLHDLPIRLPDQHATRDALVSVNRPLPVNEEDCGFLNLVTFGAADGFVSEGGHLRNSNLSPARFITAR